MQRNMFRRSQLVLYRDVQDRSISLDGLYLKMGIKHALYIASGWGAVGTGLFGMLFYIRAESRAEAKEMKAELKGEMNEMKAEMKGEINAMKGEMKEMKAELKGEINAMRGDIQKIGTDIRAALDQLNVKSGEMQAHAAFFRDSTNRRWW
jgi:septin family protein